MTTSPATSTRTRKSTKSVHPTEYRIITICESSVHAAEGRLEDIASAGYTIHITSVDRTISEVRVNGYATK